MKRAFLLTLFFIGLTASSLFAQRYEVGLSLGAALYRGDIEPAEIRWYGYFARPAIGLFGRINAGPFLSLRGGYTFLTLYGDDEYSGKQRKRGYMFRSRLHELHLAGEVNLFRLRLGRDSYLSPYLLGGGGLYSFNPQAIYDPKYARDDDAINPSRPDLVGRWIDLQPLGTAGQGLPGYEEPYTLFRPTLLGGIGLKYRVGYQWMIGGEILGRMTFFDYLDDLSNTEVIYSEVLSGNGVVAAEMSQPLTNPQTDIGSGRPYRRGGDADDYYFTFSLTLSYLFGGESSGPFQRSVKCPTF